MAVTKRALDTRPPTADELIRGFLGREVGNLLRFDARARRGVDPEGVHQLRVNARHLRSELKVVASVVRTKPLDQLCRELRWIGGELGRQRDLDVLEGIFHSRQDSPFITSTLLPQLERQRGIEQRRVAGVLRSNRYRRLIVRLSDAVVAPPLRETASQPADVVLVPGLRVVLADLYSHVDALGPAPSNETLHEIRILAKRCRYNCEIAGTFLEGSRKAASELEKVQTILGDVHDRVVAMAYLREASAGVGGAPPVIDESVGATMSWLDGSIEGLRTRWRAPLERSRAAVASLLAPD